MTAQLINQSIAIAVLVAWSSRHVLSVLLLVVIWIKAASLSYSCDCSSSISLAGGNQSKPLSVIYRNKSHLSVFKL